jgi:hypothetical protein
MDYSNSGPYHKHRVLLGKTQLAILRQEQMQLKYWPSVNVYNMSLPGNSELRVEHITKGSYPYTKYLNVFYKSNETPEHTDLLYISGNMPYADGLLYKGIPQSKIVPFSCYAAPLSNEYYDDTVLNYREKDSNEIENKAKELSQKLSGLNKDKIIDGFMKTNHKYLLELTYSKGMPLCDATHWLNEIARIDDGRKKEVALSYIKQFEDMSGYMSPKDIMDSGQGLYHVKGGACSVPLRTLIQCAFNLNMDVVLHSELGAGYVGKLKKSLRDAYKGNNLSANEGLHYSDSAINSWFDDRPALGYDGQFIIIEQNGSIGVGESGVTNRLPSGKPGDLAEMKRKIAEDLYGQYENRLAK